MFLNRIQLAMTLVLFTLFSAPAWCEVAVIVHPSLMSKIVENDITKNDIRKLFFGETATLPNGIRVFPINLAKDHETRNEFFRRVLDKSSSQLQTYWSRGVFTDKALPPMDIDTEDEVIELVSRNPNMIGYIRSEKITDSISVLLIY